MNIFRKRISLILSMVILSLAILPVFVVNAANEIDISVKLDSTKLSIGNTYTVEGGETITINATSSDVNVSLLGYYFDNDSVTQIEGSSVSITVPTGDAGSTRTLNVAAAGLNAEGKNVAPAWQTYKLKYKDTSVANKEINVKYDSKTLADRSTTWVEEGSSVSIIATPSNEAKEVYFAWDQDPWMVVYNANSYVLDFPADFKAGEEHYLYVKAKYSDDEMGPEKAYKFIIEEEPVTVSMTVKLDSKTMTAGNTYEVKGGETIKAVATSEAGIAFIGYYYSDNENIVDVYSDTLTVTVPTGTPGTERTIYIEAVAKNDDGSANTETKTGWIPFVLKYPNVQTPVEPEQKEVNVSYAGKVLTPNVATTVNPGESIKITATPADKILKLHFKWDNETWQVVNSTSDYPTRIPTYFKAGTTHYLYVKAEYTDGTVASQKTYKFVIPQSASDITMNVKLDSTTITAGRTYEVEGGEEVVVTASSEAGIDYIKYRFGSNDSETDYGSRAEFEVPDKKVGTTLKLYVEAVAEDGKTTGEKVYTLKFVETTSGKLDIEPWMEENDELVSLAINLRNDSMEEEKANKNIYALNEVITYYIDYKNGTGDDITSKVAIDFEIPLDYTVVSVDEEAEVDEDEGLITWTFEDGLEEDEAGTLVVKLKYTGFTKSRFDSERIYPSAAIFKGSKEQDRSTVINLIVEDYGVEIDETHEPYMYGDANQNTFRPDDTITRAEGALVLARIYGLNYESIRVTNIFSDLDETYLEAQKAIIAATEAGLINGYTNGTYRPNNTMTRAEFMKILACMIEMNAEDDEIEGLEVKDVEDAIKVYADSTRYYIVDGKKIYSHWALEEISLLARLNMTPLSEDEEEMELDETISRAEVAQLVNYYLLRAPASVDSKTKSGFDDVSKRHDLFADIIEATRKDHTFSMEEDGTEVAE